MTEYLEYTVVMVFVSSILTLQLIINKYNMIKLIKMINLYGFTRVINNTEYYHRKWDGECTKRYRIR